MVQKCGYCFFVGGIEYCGGGFVFFYCLLGQVQIGEGVVVWCLEIQICQGGEIKM